MSDRDVDLVAEYADILQIGARNMQNFALLKTLGKMRPAGPAEARDELDDQGTADVRRIHRGARQSGRDAVRTRHPHVRDGHPQHLRHHGGAGVERDDAPAGDRGSQPCDGQAQPGARAGRRAAVAIGADGMIVEVHPCPEKAVSDGAQSLTIEGFGKMMRDLDRATSALWKPERVARNGCCGLD